ncbi:transcriptional regulatory protein AlgP isoform X2 [Carassius carassius]|uniref:transcriptional regulatory protein AlgP isoform X2 n=1 Tax=Carassius carassius TaxID=217509 RepID=UPI0028687CEB|nr:transcriptional regulatory protein AlgP isoform X2 [Carassius carassius]
MSSKAGRIKRTKNVRNLDSHDAPSLAQSIIDEQPNIISAGRQLDRTPPSKSEGVTTSPPSKPDGSPASEQVVKDEPCGQEITKTLSCNGSNEVLQHPKVKDERKSVRRSSSTAASATSGNPDPEIFIQGMQGYKWTDTDLEFVYQTKRKKRVQQAQQELSDLQKSLKSMKQMRDMGFAALDKIQTELSKVASCERLQQISMEILLRSQSSSQLEGLDLKALLAKLKVVDVHCTTAEEKAEVSKLNTELEKAQVSREKEELLMKDIDSFKENIKQIKVNVDALKAEISALESQLSCKEETPQSSKPRQKGNRATKPSTAPKHLSDPKPPASSSAPKTSKVPATKTSKPSPAPKTTKPTATLRAQTASKPSASPPAIKTSKAPAPKPSEPSPAPKTSKPTSAPVAPKPSKPTATVKAQTASKPTTAPEAQEGDVGGLRRSKRIAGKKK